MLSVRAHLLIALVACWFCNPCTCQRRDIQAELISYLTNNITNYSPLLHPRLDPSSPVRVAMDSMIGSLVSVNSAKQSVTMSVFMQASWEEQRLVWDPRKFGNVVTVNWDPKQIWFPVIIIYNGIGDSQVLSPQIPVFIQSFLANRTRVIANWRREFEFSCNFDMSKFPSDRHICDLEFFFSDQGHGNTLVRPVRNAITFNELAIYKASSEWVMVNATTSVENRKYQILKEVEPFSLPMYIIRIEIERVSSYYIMNVVTPLLLLTMLQVLVYCVPLESGEKLGFGITIMLSYTVFLLLLDGIMPKSQSTPAIASFITAAMILSSISLLLTSLIMRFHFAPEGTRMPACARAVFVRFLGRLFCVSGAAQVAQTPSDVSESSVRKAEGGAAVRSDWVLAAQAMERFMVAVGFIATAVVIYLFIVMPYAHKYVR